jgi:hypothetical protein
VRSCAYNGEHLERSSAIKKLIPRHGGRPSQLDSLSLESKRPGALTTYLPNSASRKAQSYVIACYVFRRLLHETPFTHLPQDALTCFGSSALNPKFRCFLIMEDNPVYKVMVLGGEGVGKTALIIQFLSRSFVESVRNLALFLTLSYNFSSMSKLLRSGM